MKSCVSVSTFLGASVSLSHLCGGDDDRAGLMDSCEIRLVSGWCVAQGPALHEVLAQSKDSTHRVFVKQMSG